MVVWWWVLVYTGGKEASERGKRKKGVWRAQKIGNMGLVLE